MLGNNRIPFIRSDGATRVRQPGHVHRGAERLGGPIELAGGGWTWWWAVRCSNSRIQSNARVSAELSPHTPAFDLQRGLQDGCRRDRGAPTFAPGGMVAAAGGSGHHLGPADRPGRRPPRPARLRRWSNVQHSAGGARCRPAWASDPHNSERRLSMGRHAAVTAKQMEHKRVGGTSWPRQPSQYGRHFHDQGVSSTTWSSPFRAVPRIACSGIGGLATLRRSSVKAGDATTAGNSTP